jgi:hypothetical protein
MKKVLSLEENGQIAALNTPDRDYSPPKYPAGSRPDTVDILRNTECSTVTLKPFQKARQNPGPICALSYHYTSPDEYKIAQIRGEPFSCPLPTAAKSSFMELESESEFDAESSLGRIAASKINQLRSRALNQKPKSKSPVKPTKLTKGNAPKGGVKATKSKAGLSTSQKKFCEQERQAYLKSKAAKPSKVKANVKVVKAPKKATRAAAKPAVAKKLTKGKAPAGGKKASKAKVKKF